jgi:hypothetical protein
LPLPLPCPALPPPRALQAEPTCYLRVGGMVTADVLADEQEYNDVSGCLGSREQGKRGRGEGGAGASGEGPLSGSMG